uniref:Uncharacterized protein n=1 Tax=Oryza brachyantha TaxID=4533 RepID=J3MN35_ORYBR
MGAEIVNHVLSELGLIYLGVSLPQEARTQPTSTITKIQNLEVDRGLFEVYTLNWGVGLMMPWRQLDHNGTLARPRQAGSCPHTLHDYSSAFATASLGSHKGLTQNARKPSSLLFPTIFSKLVSPSINDKLNFFPTQTMFAHQAPLYQANVLYTKQRSHRNHRNANSRQTKPSDGNKGRRGRRGLLPNVVLAVRGGFGGRAAGGRHGGEPLGVVAVEELPVGQQHAGDAQDAEPVLVCRDANNFQLPNFDIQMGRSQHTN